MAYTVAVAMGLGWVLHYSLYRRGIQDRHNLAQFILLILLHPRVYEVQRKNLRMIIEELPAKNPSQIGERMLLYLSRHAAQAAAGSTGANSELMWKIRSGDSSASLLEQT